jgi:hypothetical protein
MLVMISYVQRRMSSFTREFIEVVKVRGKSGYAMVPAMNKTPNRSAEGDLLEMVWRCRWIDRKQSTRLGIERLIGR